MTQISTNSVPLRRASTANAENGCQEQAPASAMRVFEELQKLASECNDGVATDVGSISTKEMEEIRQLHSPPVLVRRTLEAVFLLMSAAKTPPPRLQPPIWPRVQKMLSDSGFLSKLLSFKADVLEQTPVLTSFVATQYFCGGTAASARPAIVRRSSTSAVSTPRKSFSIATLNRRASLQALQECEPLTFARVSRANRATAALFKWSALILMQAMDPTPSKDDPVPDSVPPSDEEPDMTELTPPPTPEPAPVAPQAVVLVSPEPVPNLPPKRPTTPISSPARSVAPTPVPPISPSPKPTPQKTILKDEPDRHFEILVEYVLGSAMVSESGLESLQTVAATYCMRRRLQIQVVPCLDKKETDALGRGRLELVEEWLLNNGIPEDVLDATGGQEKRIAVGAPGVICQFMLDNDPVLRDFYLMVGEGEKASEVGTKDTLYFAEWLEENFEYKMH